MTKRDNCIKCGTWTRLINGLCYKCYYNSYNRKIRKKRKAAKLLKEDYYVNNELVISNGKALRDLKKGEIVSNGLID